MNFKTLFKRKSYNITPVKSESTDLIITHITGVLIQIEKNGSVIVTSPVDMTLHAKGNLKISSDTHIGLNAPRIDLN